MKMKKLLALLLAMLMVFSFAACGSNETSEEEGQTEEQTQSLLTEVKGVTIPEFQVSVNGVVVTNETMAEYPVYQASVGSTNSSGTTSTVVYIGFKVNDMIEAAQLTGTAGSLIAAADDGYEVEWADGGSDNNMIAISKDGTQFKSAPWFIPCDSSTTGDQLKGCVKLVINGMTAPEGSQGEVESNESSELADPVKEDKSDKVTFAEYCFKIDGQEIKNADLEGLSIYKISVQNINKKGETVDHVYTGYVLMDVLDKLGLDAGSVTVHTTDGEEVEIGGAMVKNEYTLVAIEKDKETGENGTIWLACCSSHETSAYTKLVDEIKTK